VEVDVLPPVDTSGWRADTIEEHVAEVRRMFQAVLGQDGEADQLPATPVPEAEPLRSTAAPAGPERELPAVAAAKPTAGRPPLKKKLRKKKALRKAPPSAAAGAGAKKTARKKPNKKKVGVKSLAGRSAAAATGPAGKVVKDDAGA
jgi:putative phosphoserine phosphatase/1-acylglycerol-3-phosphate O-acyltransferase